MAFPQGHYLSGHYVVSMDHHSVTMGNRSQTEDEYEMNRCVYCQQEYGVEWDHYCTPEDLMREYWYTYEDWVKSFEAAQDWMRSK